MFVLPHAGEQPTDRSDFHISGYHDFTSEILRLTFLTALRMKEGKKTATATAHDVGRTASEGNKKANSFSHPRSALVPSSLLGCIPGPTGPSSTNPSMDLEDSQQTQEASMHGPLTIQFGHHRLPNSFYHAL